MAQPGISGDGSWLIADRENSNKTLTRVHIWLIALLFPHMHHRDLFVSLFFHSSLSFPSNGVPKSVSIRYAMLRLRSLCYTLFARRKSIANRLQIVYLHVVVGICTEGR